MKPRVNLLEETALDPQIPIVPYVDVFMVLSLILLGSISPLYQQSDVLLPRTELNEALSDQKEFLVVALNEQGHYALKNTYTSDEDIAPQILYARLKAFQQQKPGIKVVRQADYRCSYDQVVHLLALIHRSGFEQVSLVAEPN